jgi:hypothetical protein
MDNPVVHWFGHAFSGLHPLLQALHRNSGQLSGTVSIEFGKGLAGMIGKRLARKLGLPDSTKDSQLTVFISHDDDALHWVRRFDDSAEMRSKFVPVGQYPNGHWRESTGALALELGVEIREGGWHWVQKKVAFMGVPLPLWMFPKSHA